jgi:hypothetical protein
MGDFINRTGQRFGKLVVLKENGRNVHKKVMWECICDCGNTVTTVSGALANGSTKSCGCSKGYIKHRSSYKGSYHTWRAMRRRCNNPNDKDYPRYGAKGITVCPGWEDYLVFEADMGEPVGNQTLDRIDPYGNYEKENCRWASIVTQNRNKRVGSRNKTGYTGVIYKGGKWYGDITCKGKKYYSKSCISLEEAVVARKNLEKIHWKILNE